MSEKKTVGYVLVRSHGGEVRYVDKDEKDFDHERAHDHREATDGGGYYPLTTIYSEKAKIFSTVRDALDYVQYVGYTGSTWKQGWDLQRIVTEEVVTITRTVEGV